MAIKRNPYVLALGIIVILLAFSGILSLVSVLVVAVADGFVTGNWEFALVLGACLGLPALLITLYTLAMRWDSTQKSMAEGNK